MKLKTLNRIKKQLRKASSKVNSSFGDEAVEFTVIFKETKKYNPATRSFTMKSTDPNTVINYFKSNYSQKKYVFESIEIRNSSSLITPEMADGQGIINRQQ